MLGLDIDFLNYRFLRIQSCDGFLEGLGFVVFLMKENC